MDQIYKDFSESVGVKNIREYEEQQLKIAQETSEERLKLTNQMSKCKYQYVMPFSLPPSGEYFHDWVYSSSEKILKK